MITMQTLNFSPHSISARTPRPHLLSSRWANNGVPLGLGQRRQRPSAWQRRCQRPAASAQSGVDMILSAVGTAGTSLVSGIVQGGGALLSCLDPAVLSATVSASFKLFLICAAVGWLLRHNKIPNSTATILSQVSFQIFIPAMLFSKVASTLSSQPPGPLLGAIVAITLAQILVGAFFGKALAPLVDGQYSRERTILGWHPMNPARSAAAIAASVGTATGVPLAAEALLPRTKAPPEGIRQLTALACAFGNSFTLPAVFFMTLLPPALADRALGYAAIFLLAWSPALWSLGYSMVTGGEGDAASKGVGPATALPQQQLPPAAPGTGARPALPPPPAQKPHERRRVVSGPDWEVIEGMPPAEGIAFPPTDAQDSSSSSSGSGGSAGAAGAAAVPPESGDQPHRHPAVFDRVMQYQLLRGMQQFAKQVLNPPVLGILAGLVVGLTPWGRALLVSMNSSAGGASGGLAAAGLPPELGLVHSVVKAAMEVVELMAGGALAVQTLVLASSLLQSSEEGSRVGQGPAAAATALPRRRGWLAAARAALLPADGVEARALAVLSLTRFLLLPLSTLGVLWAAAALGLPVGGLDPVLLFVVLVEAVMPSAQNLIIVLQLSERTRRAAPGFAKMLLKQYFYAILPVTLWVTLFGTRLGIPVVR